MTDEKLILFSKRYRHDTRIIAHGTKESELKEMKHCNKYTTFHCNASAETKLRTVRRPIPNDTKVQNEDARPES